MLLGCIADDFTGATDLANTLARGGMATTQFVGIPDRAAPVACSAGVVALKTRTIEAAEAVALSLAALDWLLDQGCQQIVFKYCSTFDSTPEGNIGPVAEALLARLGGSAVVCPAFPANGRSVYQGHLFLGDRLLSDTGMRDHPLTPMTDPDIRRWLQQQTSLGVGHVGLNTLRQGAAVTAAAIASEAAAARNLVVVDAITDDDLLTLGQAVSGARLVTGGSGVALGLAQNFRSAGQLSTPPAPYRGMLGPAAALSGSCSAQSLRQVARHADQHPTLPIFPDDIFAGAMTVERALLWAADRLDQLPLVYSSATPEEVRRAQNRHGGARVAGAIEAFMAELARRLVGSGVQRLLVGGGETSGAVVTALGIQTMVIGPEIDPGVPALLVDQPAIAVALKSGNFGADDFYAKAARVLARSDDPALGDAHSL